jgi:signal transduction histidine kinase
MMSDYLAFVYGGLTRPSGDALADGSELARQCLNELGDLDKDRFPPKLLILLASPAYLDQQKAEQLLRGIHGTFDPVHPNVNLIGSSVGGVFFKRCVHPEGALLMCLASRLIEARVACGKDARRHRRGAIKELLDNLKIDESLNIDPNPLANRVILTFLPGCKGDAPKRLFYPAPGLHGRLYKGVQARIWMVGGVSSANDYTRKTDGWQFAGREVLRDSVVAASILTGVPIGVSLNDIFDRSERRVLRATEVDDEDRRTILKFDGVAAQEQLASARGVMLAKLSAEAERTVDIPLPKPGGAVQLLRPVRQGDHFQVLRPGTEISETVLAGLEQAQRRVYVRKPVASILFPCKAFNPRDASQLASVEQALTDVEDQIGNEVSSPCVGGFFDGELGVDEAGRSRLTNGGVAYILLGDEMRERTPLYQGVNALAKRGPELLTGRGNNSIHDTIKLALKVVDQTGFPGAMLSLALYNLDRKTNSNRAFIIAQQAVGSRFKSIVSHTKRSCEGDDILVIVAKDDDPSPHFIPDSLENKHCNKTAIKRSGLVSQYILPLKRAHNKSTFGTLQVDMGDLRTLGEKEFGGTEKARMLKCFAEIFSAALMSVANNIENHILGSLDKAFNNSLKDIYSPAEGLEVFFREAGKAFGVETGQLRLVKLSERDNPPADGVTLVLETGFGEWFEIEKKFRPEIRSSDTSPLGCAFDAQVPRVLNDVGSDEDFEGHQDSSFAGAPQVVNDVRGDSAWQAMLKSVPHGSEEHKRLKRIKSYAAVEFKETNGRTLGVLSFGSTKPWFFMNFHKRALMVLAGRLSNLIEHLRATFQRDFLFKVSPELAEQNIENPEKVLRHVTETFRAELEAEVASLYLWDADRKRYLLRAQSGWVTSDKWVGAANYGPKDGWIGVTAITKDPFHVPDLRAFYEQNGHKYPGGRYAVHMFGRSISDTFCVEAISLPLQIGPELKDKFGVLTLYRPIEKGAASGFKTRYIKLLQEGANSVAGLVGAVLRRNADLWERDEGKRRTEVYQGINSGDENESFEAKTCREVLKAYLATEVEFYRIDEGEAGLVQTWIAGRRRPPGATADEWEKITDPTADHSQLIDETRRVENGATVYEIAVRRHSTPPGFEDDPSAVKLDGMVEQVCIPLLGDQNYLAALVIRWALSPDVALSTHVQHDPEHLQKLGFILGSAYLRRLITRRADRSQLAVQTAGIYVFQHAHKLGNAIMSLYRLAQEVSEAQDEKDRAAKIKELETVATNNTKMIEWVINLGELIQNPAREPRSVYDLIQESCHDTMVPGYEVEFSDLRGLKEIKVIADPRLMKEVFINLINNSVKALKSKQWAPGESPEMKVGAVVSEDKETVRITFMDNGVGMSDEEVDAAERGFKPTDEQINAAARGEIKYSGQGSPSTRHKGVGILISKYLLRVQKGSLAYKSVPGKGTEAIITLPHYRSERSRKWTGRP